MEKGGARVLCLCILMYICLYLLANDKSDRLSHFGFPVAFAALLFEISAEGLSLPVCSKHSTSGFIARILGSPLPCSQKCDILFPCWVSRIFICICKLQLDK